METTRRRNPSLLQEGDQQEQQLQQQKERRVKQSRRRDRDCIRINVGGTVFMTAKSTLATNSGYFQARFSRQWDQDNNSDDDDDDNDDNILFVDQDPQIFAILLDFMRKGFIRRSQMTEELLLQADFFQMDPLIMEVKAIAFRSLYPADVLRDPRLISNDPTASELFDKKMIHTSGGGGGGDGSSSNSTLRQAVLSGILPLHIQPPILLQQSSSTFNTIAATGGGGHQEYAILSISKGQGFIADMSVLNNENNYAYVTLPVILSVPERWQPDYREEFPGTLTRQHQYPRRRGGLAEVEDCHTFLDAINWLYGHGFMARCRRNKDDSKMQGLDTNMDHLWFSRRPDNTTTSTGEEESSPLRSTSGGSHFILFDHDRSIAVKENPPQVIPQEFAALVQRHESLPQGSSAFTTTLAKRRKNGLKCLHYYFGPRSIWSDDENLNGTPPVLSGMQYIRDAGEDLFSNLHWLQQQGYTRAESQEKELEKELETITIVAIQKLINRNALGRMKVMLFSRPIRQEWDNGSDNSDDNDNDHPDNQPMLDE